MSTPSNAAAVRPRGLQFTLAALLAAMTVVALFCVALARPTQFWSELVVLLVMVALLTSLPAIVYRSGRSRAFAVGFLVFTLGFLAAFASREFLFGIPHASRPVGFFPGMSSGPRYGLTSHLGTWLFAKIHPHNEQPTTGLAGLGMSVGFDSGMGSTMTGMSAGGMMTPATLPKYDPARFMEIVHAACALLAGITGGLLTQLLYATRKREPGP